MSRTVRDVHNGQSKLARYRAERMLRKGYPELRTRVLALVRSKLRAAGVSLDQADLEACYSQAWHGLYAKVLAGETVENPEGWLVLVCFRRSIDEARAGSRARPAVGEDVASDEGAAGGVDTDLAAALDDRARLRSLFEGLRSRLQPRELEAASLCYLHGLTRAQAAERMGISERRMGKLMEASGGGAPGVASKVGELLDTIRAGGWCEQQSSLIRAYALGILDPDGERHALAVAHTRECPACRAHVAALRGLASVLPPLPLALPPRGAKGGPRTRDPAKGWRPGAHRAAGRMPRRVAAGRGLSLPAKLVVASVALGGAGSVYVLTRPAPSPARVAHPAPAQGAGGTGGASSAASRRSRVGGTPAHRRAKTPARRRAPTPRPRQAKRRANLAGAVSPPEFSPERVRGETLTPPVASQAPSAGGGREGEFGIEGG